MNKSDLLETQLRSWIPRRVSDKVTNRIFFQEPPILNPTVAMPAHSDLFRWLAPALACGLTLLAIAGGNVRHSISFPDSGEASSYVITLVDGGHSSNTAHQVCSLSKMNVNLEWNVWREVSFRPDTATAASWPSATTNK